MHDTNETFDKIQGLLEQGQELHVEGFSLEDLSYAFQRLSSEHRQKLFYALNLKTAGSILKELNTDVKVDFVESLEFKHLLEVLRRMESDDLTDLLLLFPEEFTQRVLKHLGKHKETITELLSYPPNTAGTLMAKEYLVVYQESKVSEAILSVRSQKYNKNDYHIFVINHKGQLQGMLSFRGLMLARSNQTIQDVMNTKIIAVNVLASLKEIVMLEKQYDLASIPVVDENNILLGRITFDDILDLVDEKSLKNVFRAAGLKEYKMHNASAYERSKLRLPWLFVGLCGGVVSASIFRMFEASLIDAIMLSFFTPIIMSMGGTIGIQSATIVLSDFMMKNNSSVLVLLRIAGKELVSSMMTGFVCSVCLSLVVYFWYGVKMGLLVLGSLFVIMNVGGVIGIFTPFILRRFQVNPVLATGPFIGILNDVTALVIYFSFSLLIL